MAEANVQITQGSGTNVDAYSVTGAGSQTAYRQAVVLGDPSTGANVATITGSNALKVDGSAVTQPVSGTVTANAGGGSFTVAQATGSNLHVQVDSAPTTAVTGTFWQTTQPVSGTVTANAGTGNFIVTQGTGSNLHVAVDSMPTTTVSGTVTANAGTNLNTSALALDTTVSGTQVSQGSTSSGQKGSLIQGAVTTSAPTYTTAQTSPISLTTAGAIRVDASGSTQPVSGTVTANLGTIGAAATAAKQPALGTAGTASTDVITIQGIASMTKLLVTPDSVALPANQSINNSQINGVTPLMGNGTTGTGSQRVTIASDNTAFGVNANQSGTWTVQPGNTANTTDWLVRGRGVAHDTLPTVVANGTTLDTTLDRYGRGLKVSPILSWASSNGTPVTASGNSAAIIAAPSANFHLRIHRIHITSSGAAAFIYLRDGAAGTKLFPTYMQGGSTISLKPEGSFDLTGGSTPNALFLNLSATSNIEYTIGYETVAD